jgi:hypothetical protein
MILAPNLAAANQADQLITGIDPARPCVGVVIDADLVDWGRIDAIEPVSCVADVDGAAVADRGAGGEALAGGNDSQYED